MNKFELTCVSFSLQGRAFADNQQVNIRCIWTVKLADLDQSSLYSILFYKVMMMKEGWSRGCIQQSSVNFLIKVGVLFINAVQSQIFNLSGLCLCFKISTLC